MPQVKKCKECSIELTIENSYYPKITNLLCKTHYIGKRLPYIKAYNNAHKPEKAVHARKYLLTEKPRFRSPNKTIKK